MREGKERVSQSKGFPSLLGKVLIVSMTLSGTFLADPPNGKKKQDNPPKKTKKNKQDGRVQIGNPPPL